MINSRSLNDLVAPAKECVERFIALCKDNGIDLLVTSTYRDNESQQALYEQGRTTAGKVVTNAKAGDSWHNWRCAVDVVPLVNGKPDWDGSHPGLKSEN
jgi:peptidoglycan L-alanyl-D-glutamate endopeptidase CwlK